MALLKNLALAASAAFLAGCAVPQTQPVPSTRTPPSYAVGPNPLVAKEFGNTTRALDNKNSIIYLQTFGGGGPALGVLLGPLGVAANMSMIEKATDADVALLKGKIAVDPAAVFAEISPEYPSFASATPSATSVLITPLLNVVKQENEDLLFGCSLLVDYTPTGTSWAGRYVYQLPVRYSKDAAAQGLSAEQLAALVEQLRIGFRALAKLYLDDAAGRLAATGEVKLKSTFVQPRFNFELTGKVLPSDPHRLYVRIGYAVYSLPKDPAQIIAAPAAAPAALAVTPAQPLKAGISDFSGTWDGQWVGVRRHTLVVEKIEGSTAQLNFTWGPGRLAQYQDFGSDRVLGKFDDDGSLRATLSDGSKVVYRISDDRRSLNGQWQRNERTLDGVLTRRQVP